MKQPRAIDLFSGCGGLTEGLKQAGFRVLGAIECNDLAVKTYKTNHKHVRVWQAEIQRVSVAQVKRDLKLKPGELELLAGCPPCQGFSTITTLNGKRKKSSDERNNLIFEFMRFVRGLKPRAIMLENVPGLAKDWRLELVLAELRRLGYKCNAKVLDAADYGVPQRRRRFVLLAGRNTEIAFAPPARHKVVVRDAIGKLSNHASNHPLHKYEERRSEKVMQLINRIPRDGGSRSSLGKENQLRCHRDFDGFKDIYGRMAWDQVAPTITTGCFNPSKGRFLHPTENRAITLREAALLQSFPLSYSFSLEKGRIAVAEMIGNALPPEFIRRHARQVIRTLAKTDA
jgi:DNA (cytosine-5)-methyltransferase 1